MPFKTILSPLLDPVTAKINLSAALQVARVETGHVIGLHVRQRFPYLAPMYQFPMGGEMMVVASEAHDKAAAEQAQALRALFETTCREAAVPLVEFVAEPDPAAPTASFREVIGTTTDDLGRSARLADLTVQVMPGEDGDQGEIAVIEALLMETGRPLLAVPRAGLTSARAETVMVGWDGSQQATRAIAACLPFLVHARRVEVVSIGKPMPASPTEADMATTLRHHGIPALGRHLEDASGPLSRQILDTAHRLEADLIVMGGYAHVRLQEALFGGVTHDLIRNSDRCLFLVH